MPIPIIEPIRKYAMFSGRASRSEYWPFVGVTVLLNFLTRFAIPSAGTGAIVIGLVQLGLFIPSLAVAWRRAHDTGRAGAYMLIPFYNLYVALQPGEPETNRFGPDPLRPLSDLEETFA